MKDETLFMKNKWNGSGTAVLAPRVLNTNIRREKGTQKFTSPHHQELMKLWLDWTQSLKEVFRSKSGVQDVMAGITVATVALPLSLALAVACGLPPSTGLVGGIVGGAVAAIFGGSTLQVTGPTAALGVLVLGIANDFGITGVMVTCLVIGLMQIVMSGLRIGSLVRYVPEAVLAGFTTGVGIKLLDGQIPILLGFDYSVVYLAQMMHRPAWLHEVSWICVVSGLFVVFLINVFKNFKKFPAALLGLVIVTAISAYLNWDIKRVGSIPPDVLKFGWPLVQDDQWLDLILRAIPMGILASVESLLSARVLDRMAQSSGLYNPNLELIGQGLANIGTGLFGGMPVTGGIGRSSANLQSGGKTRLASLVHALVLYFAVLFLNQSIAKVPLAGLSGLICVVAVRLIDIKSMMHFQKTSKMELLAFLATAIGTAGGYLLEGLVAGILIYGLYHYFHIRPEFEKDKKPVMEKEGIRAVLTQPAGSGRSPYAHYEGVHHNIPQGTEWLNQIQERASLARSAFVHKHSTMIGKVVLGDNVHIAPESSVRADEGSPFYIGSNSNIQDGVVLHALKDRWISMNGSHWAIYIGANVSIAHQALVHGPCFIGDNSFVGFKAVVHNAVVGSNCFIGIGAVVVGVEVPDGRYVPHGMIVDTADKVDALEKVTDEHIRFNEDVVDVNRGLAAAYHRSRRSTDKRIFKQGEDSQLELNPSQPLKPIMRF